MHRILFLIFAVFAGGVIGLSHSPSILESFLEVQEKKTKVKIKIKPSVPAPPPLVKKNQSPQLQPQNQPLMAQTFQGYLGQSSGNGGLKSGSGESIDASVNEAQNQNRQAGPIGQQNIEYPQQAKLKGIKGFVVVQAQIDVTGEILNLAVVKSEPANVFDQEVLKTIRSWKFQPQLVSGQLVKGTWTQKIRFDYD